MLLQDGCLRVWDRRERSNMATKELHVNDQGVGALSDILPPMRATAEKVVTAGADGVVSRACPPHPLPLLTLP